MFEFAERRARRRAERDRRRRSLRRARRGDGRPARAVDRLRHPGSSALLLACDAEGVLPVARAARVDVFVVDLGRRSPTPRAARRAARVGLVRRPRVRRPVDEEAVAARPTGRARVGPSSSAPTRRSGGMVAVKDLRSGDAGRSAARGDRGVVADEEGRSTLMMRSHRAGDLRAERHRRRRSSCAAGSRAAATTAARCSSTSATTPGSCRSWSIRDWPGSRSRTGCATSGCVRVVGDVSARPEGTVNAELPTGEVEVARLRGRGAERVRAAAVPARRPRRRRRGAAPAPPLPRPAARADAAQPAAARRGQPRDARGDGARRASSRSRRRC